MCPDLYKVLRRYHATNHPKDTASAPFLFLNRNGEALTEYAVETTFRRLLKVSGVTRRDGIASGSGKGQLREVHGQRGLLR